MKKLLGLLAVGLLVLVMAGPAAAAYTFEMGSGSGFSGEALSEPGFTLTYHMDWALDGKTFTLNDGESYTMDFASFWSESVEYPHDTYAQSITAIIDFADPTLTAYLGGSTLAINGKYSWSTDRYSLIWDEPLEIFFGNGDSMIVDLSDIVNAVAEGYHCGDPGDGIDLTVTYHASQVPVPAAVWLLGSGLVGLAGLRRKFSA